MTALATRRRTVAAACLLAATLVLSATACTDDGGGGGGGTKDSGSGATTEKTDEDQALEYRTCLREHGLNIPEPKPDENGLGMTIDGGSKSRKEMEKAFKACQGKAVGGGPREMTQEEKDKAVAFARCMRKNGFDMPDPKFEGGAAQALPAPKPQEMKKFEKAAKACESEGR
ncbi:MULTISPECIES: hypothetical protein [unclassified Streptomyces]|uniref:hypothetical protein n=1 Tax=unclassified Streptomyces TaxID=2593676 RepID=UPI0035DC1947